MGFENALGVKCILYTVLYPFRGKVYYIYYIIYILYYIHKEEKSLLFTVLSPLYLLYYTEILKQKVSNIEV